jgi:hypothetical protein
VLEFCLDATADMYAALPAGPVIEANLARGWTTLTSKKSGVTFSRY